MKSKERGLDLLKKRDEINERIREIDVRKEYLEREKEGITELIVNS